MRFICNQQTLSKALNIVSKAVSSKSTLQILKGIYIRVENDTLCLAASDLDISIETTINIDLQGSEEGEIVVQAKLFSDIIKKLPNEDIIVEEDDGIITIKSSNSEFKIVGLPASEFPDYRKDLEYDYEKVSLNKNIFKDMIKKSSFAASLDETKGIIVGILTELKDNHLNMVALDGFRMAILRNEMNTQSNIEKKVIISSKLMIEFGRIISELESEDEEISLHIGDSKTIARIQDTIVIMRVLQGEFIKYNDILPKEHKCLVTVSRSDLLNSIERASLFSKEGKNNLIKISIKDDILNITSRSDEGNVKEEIDISKEGIDLDIGFNSKYILDVLKVIDDEEIKILFNSPISPCLIKPLEGNSYEYLVLPVRINNSL